MSKNNFEGWYNLPSPEQTATYEPVSNRELYDALVARFELDQFTLLAMSSNYNPNYPMMENVAIFKIEGLTPNSDDMFPTLMVVNSGDKSRRVTLMVGAMVSGENIFIPGANAIALRKHTKNVHTDLEQRIEEIVSIHEQAYQTAVQFRHLLRNKVLSELELVQLVGIYTLYHKGASRLLTASHVTAIVEAVKHPHAYFPTHWELVKLIMTLIFSGAASAVLTKVTQFDELLRIMYVDKVPFKVCNNLVLDPSIKSGVITYPSSVQQVQTTPKQEEPMDEPKDITQILNTHEW